MGLFPCTICGLRFRGAACHAYPALLTGRAVAREHLRLCPPCLANLLTGKASKLINVSAEDALYPQISTCWVCDAELTDEQSAAFLTIYPRGEVERSLYGQTCNGCLNAAKTALGLPD